MCNIFGNGVFWFNGYWLQSVKQELIIVAVKRNQRAAQIHTPCRRMSECMHSFYLAHHVYSGPERS